MPGPLYEKIRRLIKWAIAVGAGTEGGTHSAVRHATEGGLRRRKWSTWSYSRSPPLAFRLSDKHSRRFTTNFNEQDHEEVSGDQDQRLRIYF